MCNQMAEGEGKRDLQLGLTVSELGAMLRDA
jgi:hypothetical protein